MLIAANRIAGANINAPDPCIATWVNFSNMFEAVSFSPNITLAAGNAMFMASVIAMSHGDEPDTPLYAPTMGPAFFPMGVMNILYNGIPAVSLLTPAISNAGNAPVGGVAIPSPNNVFLMYAGGEGASLEEALAGPAGPGRGVLLCGATGYIPIGTFATSVPSMVYGAIRDLEAQGMERLILDLRGNPGGEVTSALELAGDFLEPGTLLGALIDEDGDATDYRARAGAHHRMPLLILVDRGTASAAELFAGCLKAHGRALIAGERTHGKGVVQRVVGEGEECVSVATYRLPNGEVIQGIGIEPDLPGASPERG